MNEQEPVNERPPKRPRGRPRKHPPKVIFHRPKTSPPGKPSKLTPEVGAKICEYITLGSWLEIAAAANGIHRVTLWRWLTKGNAYLKAVRKNKPVKDPRHKKYAEFVEQVHEATARAEVNDIRRIDKFADTVWQAAAWKRDRANRDRKGLVVSPNGIKVGDTSWSTKTTAEITHTDKREAPGKNVDQLNLSLELREQLLDAIRAYRLKQQAQTIDAAQTVPPRELTHEQDPDEEDQSGD